MHDIEIRAEPVLRLQVERTGSGPPLVLVGGGLTGWASWVPFAERLASSRDVARLQLLSVQYGLENRPLPEGYSVRMESRALAAALDELGWKQPIDLVAWSYGGVITLDFALEHPERVRTLTLIEPPALWLLPDHGRARPDVQALAAEAPAAEAEDVSNDALVAFLHTAALVPPGAAPESLPQWESWVQHRRSLRNGPALFTHDDDPARIRAFRPPVLLVTGHGTSEFLRAVHDELAASFPDARTVELPGGHAPHLAAADEFLEHLVEFQRSATLPSEGEPHSVLSRDGTRIAYWRGGRGPTLLLIHGGTADHVTTWHGVRPRLEGSFTVVAMDRRGRGRSGDGPAYDLLREAEDVVAVVDSLDQPVSVLGHSYGGLVALEAARLTPGLHRLILYEGVPLRGSDSYPAGIVEKLEALLGEGRIEELLVSMYRDLVGMPPAELDLMRGQRDAWSRRLANANSLPRELRTEISYTFQPERFQGVDVPTLLLVGGDSPPRELENARGVARALPHAQVLTLEGQQHVAMHTAPELFVREVERFLLDRTRADSPGSGM